MKRELEKAAVCVLNFSSATRPDIATLSVYSRAQWERCLTWLDDMGLALYFLKAIEHTPDLIPAFVMQSLQNKHRANAERTAYLARQFECINQHFENAGIRYAAVKGLTLIPSFCSDAPSRHQSDFDYLIDDASLDAAHRLLEKTGYVIFKRFDDERIFVLPCKQKAMRGQAQYRANAPHSVELHLAVGHSPHLPWKEPDFLTDATIRSFRGSTFRGLSDEDSFMLQAIHAFHHLLDGWIKLSWLYEIGYFLHTRSTDLALWQRVSARLADHPLLREAIAVIVTLASQLFHPRVPVAIDCWIKEIRPAVLIWIENYAQAWAFGPIRIDEFDFFPVSKLVLFLHHQYVSNSRDWRAVAATRLLALKGLQRATRSVTTKQSLEKPLLFRFSLREFRRVAFHLGSGIRYFWEMPRWWYLTRACPSNRNYFDRECSPAT